MIKGWVCLIAGCHGCAWSNSKGVLDLFLTLSADTFFINNLPFHSHHTQIRTEPVWWYLWKPVLELIINKEVKTEMTCCWTCTFNQIYINQWDQIRETLLNRTRNVTNQDDQASKTKFEPEALKVQAYMARRCYNAPFMHYIMIPIKLTTLPTPGFYLWCYLYTNCIYTTV